MNTAEAGRWQFWEDWDGTFTDVVARRLDGAVVSHKLLSENPGLNEVAAIQGMRDLLGVAAGKPLPAQSIRAVKMGTTMATNALQERKGERAAGDTAELSGTDSIEMTPGDVFVIETPAGGGYGAPVAGRQCISEVAQ